MKVLVTGATGFIGRRAALRLVSQGRSVRLLCRYEKRLDPLLRNNQLVEVVRGDVTNPDIVQQACEGVSAVVHLAAAKDGMPSDEFDRTTIGGTRTLLEAATRARVPRLVYVSSMSVYDYAALPKNAVVDEDAPLESRPELRGDYARGKRAAEALVTEHAQRGALSISIVRPGIAYGPNNRSALAAVNTVRRVGGGIHVLVGGGKRQVPLVFVENLVDALILLLDCESCGGRIYNVIDSNPPSERAYLETVQRVTGSKMTVVPVPWWAMLPPAYAAQMLRKLRGRSGEDVVKGLRRVTGNVRFDTGRLQRELGWKSRTGFDEAMRLSFGERAETGEALAAART
jgi:nucleoside-diphosphate-sugar epimerase